MPYMQRLIIDSKTKQKNTELIIYKYNINIPITKVTKFFEYIFFVVDFIFFINLKYLKTNKFYEILKPQLKETKPKNYFTFSATTK